MEIRTVILVVGIVLAALWIGRVQHRNGHKFWPTVISVLLFAGFAAILLMKSCQ